MALKRAELNGEFEKFLREKFCPGIS